MKPFFTQTPASLFIILIVASQAHAQMSDNQRIQGTWQLVGGERNGQALSDELLKNVTLTFTGDKLATKNKDRVNENRFKLDESKSPAHIDLDMEGDVGEGIYELDGDKLKILHGEVGDPRPVAFDPKARTGLTLMVLKRVKQ